MFRRNPIARLVGLAAVAAALICALQTRSWGQEAEENTATETTQGSEAEQPTSQPEQDQIEPDNEPPSGAYNPTLGSPESTKNTVDASARLQQRLEYRRQATPGYTAYGNSYGVGRLALNRSWNRNVFIADGDAGAIFYHERTLRNIDGLNVSQRLGLGRWVLTVGDHANYSPEPLFGLPGRRPESPNGTQVRNDLLPDQTILTNQHSRLANTSLAQVEYLLSHRSSITATGIYGFLKYSHASAIDSNHAIGMTGYNYALSPHDTVSLMYRYARFRSTLFGNASAEVQGPSVGYARHVLARLALQISGGPEFEKTPFGSQTIAAGHGSLTYAWRRTEVNASVNRGMMSGAGLVVASNTTLAELGLSHELTRKWRVWMHGGYANHSLIGRKRDINSGFAAAELHRTLGRHGSIFVAYYFQRQVSDLVCQQSVCASDLLRHSVGAGLDWQFPLARFK